MTTIITSATNPLVKRLRRLASRKHRRREGVFVVEGIQPVWAAVDAGADVETLVVAPEILNADVTARLVDREEAAGRQVARISAELFRRLSSRDEPAGLSAIARTHIRPLAQLPVQAGSDQLFVVLHETANPGNLGTVIRTIDATGAAGAILIGNTCDPYAPAAVKASMGSLFAVDLAWCRDLDEFFCWAHGYRVGVLAASGYGSAEFWDVTYRTPAALLLGAEGPGLPADALRRSDARIRLPMTGTAESLNLSVAAGVLLYELRREHLRGIAGQMPAWPG
jgi:TrmH family RNA methyltransferase